MFFQKIDESCALTKGMAARLGVDINGTVQADPEIDAATYRSAVLRCMSCKKHGACKKLQAAHDRLDKAPDYCLNW